MGEEQEREGGGKLKENEREAVLGGKRERPREK